MQNNASRNPIESEGDIIRRIIDGDGDAFAHIVRAYKGHVANIVSRHVPYNQVEETAQEVFIRVYQSLPTYKGTGAFRKWLTSIAVRTCYDYWRKQYRTREVPLSSLTEHHQEWLEQAVADRSGRSFDELASRKEARELLDWALAQLSPENRLVLELVYLEGLSVREAAEQLGWSSVNVKVRSLRARKKLAQLLSGVMREGGVT